MNATGLQVSDKVVLHPYSVPPVGAKPRLKRGRVYCVNAVREDGGAQFVGLVGVEFRRLRGGKRDPQGSITLYHGDTFQRIGRRKEAV